jgi:phosphocarrier protein HPr
VYSKCVIMRNPSGLHARPASEFVAKAKGFQSKISVRRPGDDSFLGNAKSIIIMLSMGVGQGDSIEILADGPDEQQAVESLTALVESGFGEI